MERTIAFDRLDALPSWMKKGRRPQAKRGVVAANLTDELLERMARAMETLGLEGSSLVRVGLLHVIAEIESQGFVTVGEPIPTR